MKKMFYFVAVATFAFMSCHQEEDPVNDVVKNEPITFKASIEDFATRANINDANGLVWASGDKIGIYFPNWGDKNQSFTLSSGAGTTKGEFSRDQSGEYSLSDASAAFFPFENNNNIADGNVWFNLPKSYNSYTSGKMLTPLVANMSGSTDKISFKHAGAAVKVTINNLPAYAHSIGMSVEGKQIWGNYHINPANAGTDALVLNNAENTNNNTVWLNYTNASESAWTFIFPVPTLSSPKLSFYIFDKNGVPVWSRSPKAQPNLGRADILVMPPLNITPYSQFTKSNEWLFHGSNYNWNDVAMYTDGNYCILSGVVFSLNNEFKVYKHTASGDTWYPNGDNWKISSDYVGTKDVILNISTGNISVVDVGCPYPKD